MRLTPGSLVAAVAATALAVPLIAQVGGVAPPPPPPPPSIQTRDPAAPPARGRMGEPGVRRVPVGTGSIVGVVTAADTGRPVRGAQVSLNGSTGAVGARGGGVGASGGGGLSANISGFAGSIPGGVVIDNGVVSSQLLAMAQLSSGAAGVSRIILTDAQGQFTFQRLPAGQFTINVSKNQFLPTSYGQKRFGSPGTPIQLADGQQLKINVPISRGGVVSGIVLGEDGDPQPGVRVTTWRYMMSNGARRLVQMGGGQTDDRGAYRVFNLQPGDYLVSATAGTDFVSSSRMMADMQAIEQAIAKGAVDPPPAPGLPATVAIPVVPPQPGPIDAPPGYLPTFYPNTTIRSNGSSVHVNAGEEHSGIDIQVQLVQATNIVGSVSGGVPAGTAVEVSLMSDDPLLQNGFNSTRVSPEGKFTLRDVAPGRYTLLAQTTGVTRVITNPAGQIVQSTTTPMTQDTPRLWGRTVVTVEGQPTVDVTLSLQPARSISGSVQFDMARPPDLSRSRYMVMLSTTPGVPTMGPQPQAQVGADGRFTLAGVIPGKYSLRGSGNTESAIVEGQDTLDFPFEFTGERDISDAVIIMSDKIASVSGTLVDASGKPSTDYTIVAASADQRFWTPNSRRVVTSRPSFDGRYQIGGLPPGDYLLAAVTDLEPGGQYDPEFLKSLAGAAMRVSVAPGARLSQDLRIAR